MIAELTWKAEEVIRAVEGQCLHEQNWVAHGVSIDSATTRPGDLFIALKGQTRDRHDDVAAAFAAGAIAAIVSQQTQAPPRAPLIHVEDTFRALENLGHAGRRRSEARIIAVTGSRKSESRDMLRFMLNEVGDTYANEEGLDDRWGVPLSLARLPQSALYGVFEIGMNATDAGRLAEQIRPAVTLITAVDATHTDYFDPPGEDDIGTRIFRHMKAGGIVVLDRDDALFARLAMAAKAHGVRKVLGFGNHAKSDARMLEGITVADGSIVRADILGRKVNHHLGVPGTQAATNSLGALLAAMAAGANRDACAAILTHYRQAAKNDIIQSIELSSGSLTLIDATADTGPASVPFAIRVLGHMQPTRNGIRILVLGSVETDKTSTADLAQDIANAKIDCVFCCGEATKDLYETLPANRRGVYAQNGEELAPHIAKTARAGDIVTVKGPPDAHMRVIIDAIRALGEDERRSTRIAS